MIIEMKTPGGFPFQLSEITSDIGGKHRYVLGPNDHAAVYELSTDIAYESGPWLEKGDFFKFSRDNSIAECTVILPWRNVERNQLDISEADGFFRLSAGFRCSLPVPMARQRFFCTESRTIFAFHRADLPMKKYKISNFMSILMSSDSAYCGWSMRNFLRFAEFDGEFGATSVSDFKEEEIEYRALDFIFANYCDEIIEQLGMNNREIISRMELMAQGEQWPFRSKIFCFTLAGLKDFYF
jgi:hypothetical protein